MADLEDITPTVRIEGADEAQEALRQLGEVGANAFAQIAEAATSGNFTGLATLVGGEVAGAFTEAAHAVLEFVDAQASAIETLSNLSEATGTTLPQIEGIKDAFASVGISTNGFERAMGRLAITIGQTWSSIQQSSRTASDEEQGALLGLQGAALGTQRAYFELDKTLEEVADSATNNADRIASASLSLQRAQNTSLKDLGVDTSALDKSLKTQEDINSIIKARHELEQANQKAADDEAEANLKIQQAVQGVEKARLAEAEAAEKAYQTDLKNIPHIAEEIQSVSQGLTQWKDHADLADVSSENLAKSVIKAASLNGEEPKALDVYKQLADLFKNMGDSADAMNAKLEIVQRTMGAGFRSGQASAAQVLAVLERGSDALSKFSDEANQFSKSGIGISKSDVDSLKDFNAAWSELDAVLDQVRAHIGAIIGVGLTEFFNAARKSIEDENGVLHIAIEGLSDFLRAAVATGEAIGTIVGWINQLIQAFARTAVGQAVFTALHATILEIPTILGTLVSAINYVADHWSSISKSAQDAFASVEGFIDSVLGKINNLISVLTGPFAAAFNALKSLASSLGGASSSGGGGGGAEGRAAGGLIRGPGGPTDDKAGLFALSDHEYVVKAAAVSHYGVGLFEALNSLAVGGFATGGLVGGSRVAVAAPSGANQAQHVLNLTIDGNHFDGLRAPDNVAQRLKTFSVSRQTAATGRLPSWVK